MSHQERNIFENRHQFQLERMILFSDAVFAIVITLLVIEIKVPDIADTGMITSAQFVQRMEKLFPNLLGFAISFFIVGLFWTIHHRVFGYVVHYDSKLIWLNLVMLFTIVFLPFSTILVSEYGALDISFIIYSFNLGFIGLMSYLILRYISDPAKKMSIGLEDKNIRHFMRARSFMICVIFFSGGILCLFHSDVLSLFARFTFALIWPAVSILKRIHKVKKTAFHYANSKPPDHLNAG